MQYPPVINSTFFFTAQIDVLNPDSIKSTQAKEVRRLCVISRYNALLGVEGILLSVSGKSSRFQFCNSAKVNNQPVDTLIMIIKHPTDWMLQKITQKRILLLVRICSLLDRSFIPFPFHLSHSNLAPRVQFMAIEIARNRTGLNSPHLL